MSSYFMSSYFRMIKRSLFFFYGNVKLMREDKKKKCASCTDMLYFIHPDVTTALYGVGHHLIISSLYPHLSQTYLDYSRGDLVYPHSLPDLFLH